MSNNNTPNTETSAITVDVQDGTGYYVGFYGTAPIAQRTGAAQAAVSATAAQTTTPYGFSTSTQADAIVTLVNELRSSMVALGLIKGSA